MKKKLLSISIFVIMNGIFSMYSSGDIFAVDDLDLKSTHEEHVTWKEEIDRWKSITRSWHEKVIKNKNGLSIMEAVPDDGCDDNNNCWENTYTTSKYCSGNKCWEASSNTFFLIDFDGNSVEVWRSRCDMNADEWFMSNGNKWNCSNGNQTNEFIGIDKSSWLSDNFGQILKYVNTAGDAWESSNFGQDISHIGKDGKKIESSNFGQNISSVDESGKRWEKTDYEEDSSGKIYDTTASAETELNDVNMDFDIDADIDF